MASRLFLVFAFLTVISLCSGRYLNRLKQDNQNFDRNGMMDKENYGYGRNGIMDKKNHDDNDVQMFNIQDMLLHQAVTSNSMEIHSSMENNNNSNNKDSTQQMFWVNINGNKMRLPHYNEEENINEPMEIKRVEKMLHDSNSENTGKGRQVVNHSSTRGQQTAQGNNSQEMMNKIYRD